MGLNDLAALGMALQESELLSYEQAWTMPKSYYTSPALLDIERERLFGKEWICIGRAEEIPNPGDYMAFQLCDEPLVAVRGEDEKIRVMSNVCRHRGTILARGNGHGRRLICPYHHWSYDLEGKLAGAPRMDAHETFDKSTCRLPQFASEEWRGFLFTNLRVDPEPLSPRLAGLDRQISNYHMEQQKLRWVADEVWHTNWKCLIENFMEGYHLSPLHKTTLAPVNPTKLCSHFEPGDAYFGYNAGYSADYPRSTRGHPDLSDAEVVNCVMFAIPPGLVSGCGGDYSSFICVQPVTTDRVRAKMGLIFYGDEWTKVSVDHAVELFNATMAEDKTVLVDMLRGMASAHHARGPLAPAAFEGPVLDFYRYYSHRLGKEFVSGA